MGHVLWIVNHYAGLPSEPGGTRHYWLGRGLQRLGWDVRIIRSGAVPSRRPWEPHTEVVDGVEVTTISGPPTSVRGLTRVRSWAEFSGWALAPSVTKHLPRPDLVLGSAVHLGAAWAARTLARRHGVPFVFEVRDLWPETLIAMGALNRGSLLARTMLKVEGTLARSSSLIVSPLPGVGEYMAERHGIPKSRFVWVSNGVQLSERLIEPPSDEGRLRLQYFGAVGPANCVGDIIGAVRQADGRQKDVCELQIIGRGPERDRLMGLVAADPRLAELVAFPAPVASQRLPELMRWGNSVILQVPDRTALYRYGISPNKLFDYLASRRWIVMGAHVRENPAAEAPGAMICGPTVDSLADAILQSAQLDPRERLRLANKNFELVREKYDYPVLAQKLDVSLQRSLTAPDPTIRRHL